jgi:hypothetical protein
MKLETHLARLQEAQPVVDQFIKVTSEVYGNHSYAAGYLGSVLATTLPYLSKEQFNIVIEQLSKNNDIFLETLSKK